MSKNVWWHIREICLPARKRTPEGAAEQLSREEITRLGTLLKQLPEDDESLLGVEGAAVYHEATGNLRAALLARRLHVERLDLLQRDIETSNQDAETLELLLERCNESIVRHNVLAIQRLERLLSAGR